MDNFYVDDMPLSVHTTEQASEVIHEMKSLLAKGGFNLTKWFSNFEEILENSENTPIESEDNCSKGPRIPAENELNAATRFVNSATQGFVNRHKVKSGTHR